MSAFEVRAASDPVVVETPTPVAGPGEALVRNRYFTVFAALRTLLAGGVPGAPFPGLPTGDTLFGPAVGEVVTAPEDSGLRPGDLVQHMLGWRTHAVAAAGSFQPIGDSLPDPVAHLARSGGPAARRRPGTAAPVEIDTYRLILKQITLTGYSAHGDGSVRSEWIERFAGWLHDGVISFPHTHVEGIAKSPRKLHDVLTGRHLGTVIVAV